MTDNIVVLSACGSAEEAANVARALVERRLAACVNIVSGIRSIYRWKGVVEEAAEWLLVIKSRRPLFGPLVEELRKVHSYETPEVIALPIVVGAASYLEWLVAETAPQG
jgi:periplasmic divalent cation tolerance protein